MIKIENTEVMGWEAAIRGMRNPMNSWEKSDSVFISSSYCDEEWEFDLAKICHGKAPIVKTNDLDLMTRLANAGPVHAKYRRMITVYVDITAPLYWWKEFDTYKVGTVANSCSTMHKIHEKEFTIDDFSHEHLIAGSMLTLSETIDQMNDCRALYLEWDSMQEKDRKHYHPAITCKKDLWWQLIQLLPSSYNQRRTVMLNYEVLSNIYEWRKDHKLDEWRELCKWIETLPYSEIITGKVSDSNEA